MIHCWTYLLSVSAFNIVADIYHSSFYFEFINLLLDNYYCSRDYSLSTLTGACKVYECLMVSYLIAELMLLDSGSVNSYFRSCIASYILVHIQIFLPLVCVWLGILLFAHYTFLCCLTGYEWSSVPDIVCNGGWVRIILVFCFIDGMSWTQFQSWPKWHALSTFCNFQGFSLSLSLSLSLSHTHTHTISWWIMLY